MRMDRDHVGTMSQVLLDFFFDGFPYLHSWPQSALVVSVRLQFPPEWSHSPPAVLCHRKWMYILNNCGCIICCFLDGETTSIRGVVRWNDGPTSRPVRLEMFHHLIYGYMIFFFTSERGKVLMINSSTKIYTFRNCNRNYNAISKQIRHFLSQPACIFVSKEVLFVCFDIIEFTE